MKKFILSLLAVCSITVAQAQCSTNFEDINTLKFTGTYNNHPIEVYISYDKAAKEIKDYTSPQGKHQYSKHNTTVIIKDNGLVQELHGVVGQNTQSPSMSVQASNTDLRISGRTTNNNSTYEMKYNGGVVTLTRQ